MDKPLAGYVVSVWADPDIGEATFYIVVESPSGGPPAEKPRVSMWFEPVSGRLERATCDTTVNTLRNQLQYVARPHFDRRDQWEVGFRITSRRGAAEDLTTHIESTPPGFGPWDLAIYLFPFALLGGMWLLAINRRRHLLQAPTSHPEAYDSCDSQVLVKAKSEQKE
jgi:hypothetical protein